MKRYTTCCRRAILLSAAVVAPCAAQVSSAGIPRPAAIADLERLGQIVREHSAYRLANTFRLTDAIAVARTRLPDTIALQDFHYLVQTLVGRLRDAHSDVRLPAGVREVPSATLPFVALSVADTIVAMAPGRRSLLVPGFPRLVAINGIPIDSLMRIAGARVVGHSGQRFRLRALEELDEIEAVLTRAGAFAGRSLAVQLGGVRDTTVRVIALDRRIEPFALRSVAADVVGPVAILRIPKMFARGDIREDAGYRLVVAAMESQTFRHSRALILDMRGNRGGTRDILEYLAPFFVHSPLVYNVAAVRRDTNGVGERGLLDPSDSRLSPPVAAALRTALAAFQPHWRYPVADFLPGLYGAVVEPVDPARSFSDRPVVVLMDEASFSATDLFLGAMRLAPNVTLMGLPSGGGSGRAREFVLPASGLTVRLSTMASFQPDGKLYDGVGVMPTITVPRTLEDLANGRDTQLEAALRFLLRQVARP